MKILIAVPSGNLIQAHFVECLFGLFGNPPKDTQLFYGNKISSRITENRNGLVALAKELNCTHMLFVDSDMTFPADALTILLSHDKDIVGATACHRQGDEGKPIGVPVDMSRPFSLASQRLIPMQVMGLPFTLIKMHVFDKLKKPYFAEPFDENGELVPEDNYFYISAARAGFEIWCDSLVSMHMGHIGIKEYRIKPDTLRLVENVA